MGKDPHLIIRFTAILRREKSLRFFYVANTYTLQYHRKAKVRDAYGEEIYSCTV